MRNGHFLKVMTPPHLCIRCCASRGNPFSPSLLIFCHLVSNCNIARTLDTLSAYRVVLGVSITHQTLMWTTWSLTRVCDLFACIYTRGTSVYSLNRRTFCRNCAEFDSREIICLARNSHPSSWWPHSIVLNSGFREQVLSLCATDSPVSR